MEKYIDDLYENSVDFRTYVEKYCRDYGYTVQEALEHALVNEVAKYYWKQESEKEEKKVCSSARKYTGELGNGIPA